MSAYTKGPWTVKPGDSRIGSLYVGGSSSHPIECYGVDAKANARLIAAAPDLYEALLACVAVIEAQSWGKAWAGTPHVAMEQARAALAKARI